MLSMEAVSRSLSVAESSEGIGRDTCFSLLEEDLELEVGLGDEAEGFLGGAAN